LPLILKSAIIIRQIPAIKIINTPKLKTGFIDVRTKKFNTPKIPSNKIT
jgi:hypothetical protein